MSSQRPPPPPLPPLGWRTKRKMATPTTTTTDPPKHPCPPRCKNPNHKLNLPFPSPPSLLPRPSFLPSTPKPPRAPKPPTRPTQITKLPSIPHAFFVSQGHIPFNSSSQPIKSATLALTRTDTDKRRMMRLYARGLRSAPFPSKMRAAVVAAVSAQKPVEVTLPFKYGAHDPELLDRISAYHETFDDVMVEAREMTNGAYPPAAEKDCRPVHYDVPEMAKCWKREVAGVTGGRGGNVVLEVGENEEAEEGVEKAAGEVVLEVVEAMRRSRFVRFETGDEHEDIELSAINYMRRYRRLARVMKV